jgi:hypothetical protein
LQHHAGLGAAPVMQRHRGRWLWHLGARADSLVTTPSVSPASSRVQCARRRRASQTTSASLRQRQRRRRRPQGHRRCDGARQRCVASSPSLVETAATARTAEGAAATRCRGPAWTARLAPLP